DPNEWLVRRFGPHAPAGRPFTELPGVGGTSEQDSAAPRRFSRPQAIAAGRDALYVADSGNSRVQVFALGNLALRAIWTFATEPRDVAVFGDTVYVLSGETIYRHRPGDDWPQAFAKRETTGAAPWDRLAVDREGRAYVLASAARPARLD